MNRRIAILSLVSSAFAAISTLLISRPLDKTVWLAIIWVTGAVMSFIMGLAQIKSSRRLGLFCVFGGAVMLFFAVMLLPAFRRAKSYTQQSAMSLKVCPPKPAHSLDAGFQFCFIPESLARASAAQRWAS